MPISSSETPSSAAEDFGPYFFAWTDEGIAFDPYLHTRFDDDIFDFTLEQQEGDFASLSITIQNPRVGLLSPGRQIWCWFSWWNGIEAVPLFNGRLVGLPDNLHEEEVTLHFIARPSNFQSQKDTLAATMRDLPFFDPIWFAEDSRYAADNVLEARPEAWHVDRITHEVTTSNIIDGEDGTVAFDEDQVFNDSVGVTYSTNPLRSVTMNAQISWEQAGTGTVTMPNGGAGLQPGYTFQSYTGMGIVDDWPKPNSSIGGGWSYAESTITASGAVPTGLVGDIIDDPNDPNFATIYADGGFDTSLGTYLDLPDGTHIGFSYHVAIPNITIGWHLVLKWDANRRKTENLTFTLVADVQDIITLADDGEALVLNMSTSEVTNAVDTPASEPSSLGGSIPIRSPLARGYFNTSRGASSIQYLIAVARAHLLSRARCVKIDFEVSFEDAVAAGISLRKNAAFSDERLPGTDVLGKIIAYELSLSGGAQRAKITIGATIGKDGTQVSLGGEPDWVEEGYVEVGYQTYTGQYDILLDADVAYEDQQNVEPNDDGLNFTTFTSNIVQGFHLVNRNGDDETQEDALDRWTITTSLDLKVSAENTTYAYLTWELPDLTGGPFETNYIVNVTDLKIPRTINLEATSEGASS